MRHREGRFFKKTQAVFFAGARRLFAVLPLKASFFLITLTRFFDRRISFFLVSDFRAVLQRNMRPVHSNFSSLFTTRFPLQATGTLICLGAFQQAREWLSDCDPVLYANENFFALALDYLDWGEFEQATSILHRCSEYMPTTPLLLYYKACIALLDNNEALAVRCLLHYADHAANGWCPHQNIAARYPEIYAPQPTDKNAGSLGLLYDAYNFLGQRVIRVGRGELAIDLYRKTFEIQDSLIKTQPQISEELQHWLQQEQLRLEDLHIFPWEWVTQIGHLGMLDIQFQMRDLGWWSGPAVILAPPHKTANKALLSLFEKQAKILINGVNISENLAQELFSLQRYRGTHFNAWRFPDGEVVAWQQAGARLMRQWEAAQKPYPLRQAFDEGQGGSQALSDHVAALKREWGMQPEDWYVCLHVRDAEFYGELRGFGQAIRNSGDLETYQDAIRYITDQGGWVIKLGGPKAPALPAMPRVVDYARSPAKSELLDLYLIRHARFFIGTTSGLTNVAISFNGPCALVNCASPDAQLWSSKVRFIFKPIIAENGQPLNQLQMSSTPWRWRTFNVEVLERYGARIQNNTADEILETVKEVFHLALGKMEVYQKDFPEEQVLLSRWQRSLDFPEFYGAALPSLYYLQKHANTFLLHSEAEDRNFFI